MTKAMINQIFLTAILCVSFLFNSIHSTEDACLESKLCLCSLSDNRYIDLSPLNEQNLTAARQNLTFYYYPCRNVSMNYSTLGINSTESSRCGTGATLCLFNATDQTFTNLGLAAEGKFSNTLPRNYSFTHDNIVSTILLVCVENDLSVSNLFYDKSDGNRHNFILYSPKACVLRAHPGLSVGSTLLILSATIFGVYLIGGALIMHFLRGARGKEMIPNIDFWTELPGLVKDGTIFVLTGCNPLVISSADTYDRI